MAAFQTLLLASMATATPAYAFIIPRAYPSLQSTLAAAKEPNKFNPGTRTNKGMPPITKGISLAIYGPANLRKTSSL